MNYSIRDRYNPNKNLDGIDILNYYFKDLIQDHEFDLESFVEYFFDYVLSQDNLEFNTPRIGLKQNIDGNDEYDFSYFSLTLPNPCFEILPINIGICDIEVGISYNQLFITISNLQVNIRMIIDGTENEMKVYVNKLKTKCLSVIDSKYQDLLILRGEFQKVTPHNS